MTGKRNDLTRSELLELPGLLDEAMARTPAPDCGGSFEEWRQNLTGIMCWLRYLGRDGEAVSLCTRWSESAALTAEQRSNNASIIRSNAAFVGTLSADDVERYACGFMFRSPDLIHWAYTQQSRELSPEVLRQREEQRQQRREELEHQAAEAEAVTMDQRRKAATQEVRILQKATKAVTASPYWQAKEKAAGIPLPVPEGLQCGDVRMFLPIVGQSYWNNSVIVPLYCVTEALQLGRMSLEVICGASNPAGIPTGTKRGIKGSSRHGAFFPIGLGKTRNDLPLVICEGLMSGIALSLMTGGNLPVICAMSCGNFSAVIDELRMVYQSQPLYIVGDVGVGHEKALELARADRSSLIHAVELEPCLPEQEGADPFDLLARHGVENGRVLLRSMFRSARGDATVSPSLSPL